jgi:N-acyl-D-amino-acid deacylase
MTRKSSRRIDIAIIDSLVFDGSGKEPFLSNIGISGEKIVAINKDPTMARRAKRIIDAHGLSVAPGFIDTHGHSEFTLVADPRAEGKLLQGITTEINGNCGLSAAPLAGETLKQREEDLRELGIPHRWSNFKEYFKILNEGMAINFATLVGHGNVRACAMGYENRKAHTIELDRMKRLLRKALTDGALGLSTGLAYPPGIYSDTEELIDLCTVLARSKHVRSVLSPQDTMFTPVKNKIQDKKICPGPIFTAHIRNEGDALTESVEEIIRIGKETGIRVHISHIKTSGRQNWSKIDKLLPKIEKAQGEGVCITCDRYPYIASSTDLDILLPSWVYAGGAREELKRLLHAETRERIRKEILVYYPEREFWQQVRIATVSSEKNKWIEGESIASVAHRKNAHPVNLFLNLLIEEKLRVSAIFSMMSEDNLMRFLSRPYVMIGSDSAARSIDGLTSRGKPHPRGFGSFPRFLGRYARDQGLMDFSAAIHKVTMLPAQTFMIARRGIIKRGAYADIVVFDRKTIIDRATFDEPFLKPEGIHYVLVNGSPALWEGKITGNFAGRILRHGK